MHLASFGLLVRLLFFFCIFFTTNCYIGSIDALEGCGDLGKVVVTKWAQTMPDALFGPVVEQGEED